MQPQSQKSYSQNYKLYSSHITHSVLAGIWIKCRLLMNLGCLYHWRPQDVSVLFSPFSSWVAEKPSLLWCSYHHWNKCFIEGSSVSKWIIRLNSIPTVWKKKSYLIFIGEKNTFGLECKYSVNIKLAAICYGLCSVCGSKHSSNMHPALKEIGGKIKQKETLFMKG